MEDTETPGNPDADVNEAGVTRDQIETSLKHLISNRRYLGEGKQDPNPNYSHGFIFMFDCAEPHTFNTVSCLTSDEGLLRCIPEGGGDLDATIG